MIGGSECDHHLPASMIVPVGDQFVDVECHAVNQIKAKLTGKRLSHIHDECFNQIAASNATAVTTITHTISLAAAVGSLHWLQATRDIHLPIYISQRH